MTLIAHHFMTPLVCHYRDFLVSRPETLNTLVIIASISLNCDVVCNIRLVQNEACITLRSEPLVLRIDIEG